MGFLSRLQSFFQAKELDISKRFELLREAITGTLDAMSLADLAGGPIAIDPTRPTSSSQELRTA